MRNPNRLVACVVTVFLCLGVAWWMYQDTYVAKTQVSKAVQPVPHSAHVASSLPSMPQAASVPSASTETSVAPTAKPAPIKFENAISAFRDWAARYQSADAASKSELVKEGQTLAVARRLEMQADLENNPRKFLANVLPYELRKDLPDSITKEMESVVNGMGKNKASFAMHAENGPLSFVRRVEVDGVEYRGVFAGVPNGLSRGVSFPVNGAALGRNLALGTDTVRILSAAEVADLSKQGKLPANPTCVETGASVANPTGWAELAGKYYALCSSSDASSLNAQVSSALAGRVQLAGVEPGATNVGPQPQVRQSKGAFRILVARFQYKGDPAIPAELSETVQFTTKAATVIRDYSYGSSDVIPVFTPVITLAQSRQWYSEWDGNFNGRFVSTVFGAFGRDGDTNNPTAGFSPLIADAERALREAGYDVDSYDHLHALFPTVPSSNFVWAPPYTRLEGSFDQTNTSAALFPFNPFSGGAANSRDAQSLENDFQRNVHLMVVTLGSCFGISTASLADTRMPWGVDNTSFGRFGANNINYSSPWSIVWPSALSPNAYILEHVYGLPGVNRAGLFDDPLAAQSYEVVGQHPFDPMGNVAGSETSLRSDVIANTHYSAVNKMILGWIPTNYVTVVNQSSTNRLYAFDIPYLKPGNLYVLGVRKDVLRTNWIEYRQKITRNPWVSRGVLINWGPWLGARSTCQLVDTTPGSVTSDRSLRGFEDSAVVLGRTFSDEVSGTHITPTLRGSDDGGEWIDVVVHVGTFAGNRAPQFDLVASTLNVQSNAPVTFKASNLVDPDGDAVAYYWEFGDGSFGDNQAEVSHSFAPGQYVVRCEVSDMKGGVRSSHVLITADGVNTTRVSGRVVDLNRNPIANVRVAALGASDAVGFTDSDGRYTIAGIPSGTVTNVAHLYGWTIVPDNFHNPSPLTDGAAAELNYVALTRPTISVEPVRDADLGGNPLGGFRFKRTGLISEPLTISYRLDGDAQPGIDYAALTLQATNSFSFSISNALFWREGSIFSRFFFSTGSLALSANSITFPAGERTVDLPVRALKNPTGGGTRSLYASVVLQSTGVGSTNGVKFEYAVPSWYASVWRLGAPPTWGAFQAPENYVISQGEASIRIVDPAPEARPLVSLQAIGDSVNENGYDAGQILFVLDRPVGRDLKVRYSLTGSAKVGIDFLPLSGEVTIPAGSAAAVLPIFAIPNLLIEGNRDLTINIADGIDYDAGNAQATVYIVDDDLPAVRVYALNETIFERPDSVGKFDIVRSGDLAEPLQVDYVFKGTATNGLDFQTVSGRVTIPARLASATVDIAPIADNKQNAPKTVILQLSPNPRYNVSTPALGTMEILDAQTPIVRIQPAVPGLAFTSETGARFEFEVSRSGPTTEAVYVNFVTGGTAGNGADYQSIGSGVTIPAGQASVRIPIVPIQDEINEWRETITIRLTPGDGYQVDPAYRVVEGLLDQSDRGQYPSAEFTVQETTVKESDGRVTLGIHLTGAHPQTSEGVVVEYRVAGGSAVLGEDYRLLAPTSLGSTGFVRFFYDVGDPLDERGVNLMRSFTVEILDNKKKQGPRTIAFELAYPDVPNPTITNTFSFDTNGIFSADTSVVTNGTIAPTYFRLTTRRFHWITIQDDDASEVSVQAVKPYAYESGVREGAFKIVRTGTNGYAEPMTVQFDVSGTASAAGDYRELPRSVVIPAGQREVIVPVVPVDDLVYEGPETVVLNLVTAEGGSIGADKSATVTIVDDDGTIEFAEREFHFSEREGVAHVPVRRVGDATLAQAVNYTFTAGTATAGLDYVANSGTLIFQPGEKLKTIDFVIIDDDIPELPESIDIRLSNQSGGVSLAGQSQTTVVIESDDTGFVFGASSYAVPEYSSGLQIEVNRVGNTDGSASVTVGLASGAGDSAVAGTDLVNLSETLRFADGETLKTFTVIPIDDALVEGDETISLVLSDPQNGALSPATSVAQLTIRDDDCTVDFAITELSVWEHHLVARVQVRRAGGALNDIAVDYATADGTATAGKDYTARAGTLVLKGEEIFQQTDGSGGKGVRPGEVAGYIDIPLLDDELGEPSENLIVTLRNPRPVSSARLPQSVNLGTNTVLNVIILDNEQPGRVDDSFGKGLVFKQTAEGDTNGLLGGAAVNAIALLPNGRAIIAGDFTEVNDYTYRHIARLTLEGALDLGFDPGVGADATVRALATTDDGRIFLGGDFKTVQGADRSGVALLTQEGALDASFDPGLGAGGKSVKALAVQTDGFVLVGGEFTSFDGISRTNLVRLDPRGFVDSSFVPVIGGAVNALAVQADGKILVGGSFTNVNTNVVGSIVRLNPDGSVDSGFAAGKGFKGVVNSLAIQSGGQILVGGAFSSVNGKAIANLARLNVDGGVDASFPSGAGPNGAVRSVGVHRLGKIYIGGDFTLVSGSPKNRFARLLSQGSVDEQFSIGEGADAPVRALLVAANSAVYIGGEFSSIDGEPRPRFARIHGDEKLALVGVEFVTSSLTVPENFGSLTLTVRRVGDTQLPFTVDFKTLVDQGTASAGKDYVPTNGTLTFGAGVTSRSFKVQLLDDSLGEPTETIVIGLENAPFGVDLGGATVATIHLLDDEVTVGFASTNFVGSEASDKAVVTVVRRGNLNASATVQVIATSGTAIAGQDFDATPITVSFAPLEVSKDVTIAILPDSLQEGTEQFSLNLQNPSQGLLLANSVATVSIVDNDFDKIAYVGSALVAESNANGSIDPGETTTINVALRNIGNADSTNVTARLLGQGGVVPIEGTANYGQLTGLGRAVSRPFTFRNTRADGEVLDLTLELQDGGRSLGQVPFQLSVGSQSVSFSNHERITLNDLSKASPYPSQIQVAGVIGQLVKATLTFEGITHSAPGDLDIMLVAPNGQASVVMSDAGGTFQLVNATFTLDDDAAAGLPSSSLILSGATYRPTNYVANESFPAPAPTTLITKQDLRFPGIDPNGTWSLFIKDDSGGDAGFINNGWTLKLTTSGQLVSSTDLEVTFEGTPSVVPVGQNLSYTVRVANNGPANATGVTLVQSLPADASFVSATGGAQLSGGNQIKATIPSLASGASASFVVTVAPTQTSGQLVSTAKVTANEVELIASNNEARALTTVSTVAPAVALRVASVGDSVVVSWPASGVGSLETTLDPALSAWLPVHAKPVLAGDRLQVVLPASNHCQFYRLK